MPFAEAAYAQARRGALTSSNQDQYQGETHDRPIGAIGICGAASNLDGIVAKAGAEQLK